MPSYLKSFILTLITVCFCFLSSSCNINISNVSSPAIPVNNCKEHSFVLEETENGEKYYRCNKCGLESSFANVLSFGNICINDKTNNFYCETVESKSHFYGKPLETKIYDVKDFVVFPGSYVLSGLSQQDDSSLFFQLIFLEENNSEPACKQIGSVPSSTFNIFRKCYLRARVLAYGNASIDCFASIKLEIISFIDSHLTNRMKPMLTFIDDDGKNSFIDNWIPIIDKHRIPICCAAITSEIGQSDHLSWDKLKMLKNNYDVEVINHSELHNKENCYFSDDTVFISESLQRSIDSFQKNGFDSSSFVYPENTAENGALVYCVSKMFKYGINSAGGIVGSHDSRWLVPRVNLDTTKSFDYYKNLLDEIKTNEKWLIFMVHSLNKPFDSDEIMIIDKIINYSKSIGIDICSFSSGTRNWFFN